jgi:lambda family phage minor tail protein L
MPIESVVQSLSPGQRVELYQLDATIVGSGIYHFTSGQYGNTPVKFNGISYTPIDLDATGFDYSGQGASPRPKIKISNAASFLAGEIIQYNDMVGSTFTRIRTYKQFLDGQPLADPGSASH